MAESLQFSQSKKHDLNSDSDDDDYEEYCEHFTYSQTTTCCVCNGYYAPSFGEPLCGTCHAFLFPVIEEKRSTDLSDSDEDSGNDEPDLSVDAVAGPSGQARFQLDQAGTEDEDEGEDDGEVVDDNEVIIERAPVYDAQNEEYRPRINDRIIQYENAFLTNRPEPDPPRNLRQYLNALTENHEPISAPNQNHLNSHVHPNKVTNIANGPSTSNAKTENRISELPVEVLLVIFSYLDDISLCNSAEVCKQWKSIVEAHTPQSMWERYTKSRWPLYRQITQASNWFKVYSSLMSSCFCHTCVIQMTLRTTNHRENRFRSTRLRGDIRTLTVDATEGIEAVPLDDQLTRWQASIIGPTNSPYEGGKFFLHIQIPFSYPMHPPVVRFLTKIIHPNVSRHGDVGIDIIQHNWSLCITISKLLLSVQSLLTDPFTEVCMEPELGRLYDHDRQKFEALARRWTWKYAMFEVIP